jgi:hypothetical protein
MMDLARDLLDVQLLDPRQRPIGRVDGILLEVRPGQPPSLAAIEVGALTLVRRVNRPLARWVNRVLLRWLGISWRPVRFRLEHWGRVGVDIEIKVGDRAERRLLRFEDWLSTRIVRRLPGGTKGAKR